MGGHGSGFQGVARPVTDEALRLDVRWLARRGLFGGSTADVLTWTQGEQAVGRIAVRHDAVSDRVELLYDAGGPGSARRSVREHVPILRSGCPFGGTRPWFGCPGCGRRCAVLWGLGGLFRCRACHDLAYASTRDSGIDRARRQRQRLWDKLGLDDTATPLRPCAIDKPARMHWSTFDRLAARLVEADRRVEAELEIGFLTVVARTDMLLAERWREIERLGIRQGWRGRTSESSSSG